MATKKKAKVEKVQRTRATHPVLEESPRSIPAVNTAAERGVLYLMAQARLDEINVLAERQKWKDAEKGAAKGDVKMLYQRLTGDELKG